MEVPVKDYPPYLDYPKPRKKQTNADRIRAMTDEELADVFIEKHDDENYFACPVRFFCGCSRSDCMVCFLDWLKREVEE